MLAGICITSNIDTSKMMHVAFKPNIQTSFIMATIVFFIVVVVFFF